MEAFLMRRGSTEAESSGVTSKDVTAAKAHVLKGKQTITSDSNDAVVEGTMKDWTHAGQKEVPVTDDGKDTGGFGVVYEVGDAVYNGIWVHVPEGYWPYKTDGSAELKLPIADVRNVLNIDPNLFLKTATIAGISGNINNYSGQTRSLSGYENVSLQPHPVDPSQGLVSAKFVSGAGYFDGTSIATCNVANLNAGNIKHGVKVGRTTLAGHGADDTNTITGTYTSDGTVTAADVRKGKIAYSKGQKVTGSMSEKAAATYTPRSTAQTIAAGQYLAGAQTIAGDANLIAANIKKGVTIFGVTGTWEGYVPTVNDLYSYGNQLVAWKGNSSVVFDTAQIRLTSGSYIETSSEVNLVGKTQLNVLFNAESTNESSFMVATADYGSNSIGLGGHACVDGEQTAVFPLANAQVNKKIRITCNNIGYRYIKRIWLS
ncbi:MAG: hypothetical protein Q4D90_02465 [bacterium]|nr:hypothetical protein [bacterium]